MNKSFLVVLIINALIFTSFTSSNLLAQDAKVNAFEKAIRDGNLKEVKKQIKKGADPNIQFSSGETALALSKRNSTIAEFLLSINGIDVNGWNINRKDGTYNYTNLMAVLEYPGLVKILLDKGAKLELLDNGIGKDGKPIGGCTALMLAIQRWNAESAKLLIDKGASIDVVDADGQTLLIQAVLGVPSIISGDGTDNYQIVKLLLNKGAKTDILDKSEYNLTALMWAISTNSIESAKLIIDKGANLEIKNKKGQTALHWAVLNKKIDFVQLLLEKGAKINAVDDTGTTPLMFSAYYKQADMLKLLVEKGANVKLKNKAKKSALSFANSNKMTDSVKLLKAKGAKS